MKQIIMRSPTQSEFALFSKLANPAKTDFSKRPMKSTPFATEKSTPPDIFSSFSGGKVPLSVIDEANDNNEDATIREDDIQSVEDVEKKNGNGYYERYDTSDSEEEDRRSSRSNASSMHNVYDRNGMRKSMRNGKKNSPASSRSSRSKSSQSSGSTRRRLRTARGDDNKRNRRKKGREVDERERDSYSCSTAAQACAEVEYEKQAFLIELERMRQNGIEATRRFSMRDSLEEIEFECSRLKHIADTKNAVRFMRDSMHLAFSGIEFANGKYGPFLQLDGWSAELGTEMNTNPKFDNVCEKLYKKHWRRGGSIAPEIELGVLIMSSMAMHHFRTRLFGSPTLNDARQSSSSGRGGYEQTSARNQQSSSKPPFNFNPISMLSGLMSSMPAMATNMSPPPPPPATNYHVSSYSEGAETVNIGGAVPPVVKRKPMNRPVTRIPFDLNSPQTVNVNSPQTVNVNSSQTVNAAPVEPTSPLRHKDDTEEDYDSHRKIVMLDDLPKRHKKSQIDEIDLVK